MDQDPPSQNRSGDLFLIGGNQGNPPPKDIKIRGEYYKTILTNPIP